MPPRDAYIEKVLSTDAVSPATKSVISKRMVVQETIPVFFEPDQFRLLIAVSRQLLALPEGGLATDIAAQIDKRLAAGISNGWRYRQMPGDGELYLNGLQALDGMAATLHQAAFASLPATQQIALLHLVQSGDATGDAWNGLSPKIFFEELLAEATELFYSYPYAQNEIGYTGFADAHGWKEIGLNEEDETRVVDQQQNNIL